jgi:hypothetical protein
MRTIRITATGENPFQARSAFTGMPRHNGSSKNQCCAGDSSVWPTRFFGLAKEDANKPRVVAAVDAESDIDVESTVPVVKSRTVSDSFRECGGV